MKMTTREHVSNILKTVKPSKDLENVENMIEGGYIDSFELMLLISTLCEEFGIEIGIDDIVPENFNSLDNIVDMVERLMSK
ncbi:MAG: acyl carrier protein [Clostridiales bacterium]|nr:acyl carrier protein [Clostridiales bacterium]